LDQFYLNRKNKKLARIYFHFITFAKKQLLKVFSYF